MTSPYVAASSRIVAAGRVLLAAMLEGRRIDFDLERIGCGMSVGERRRAIAWARVAYQNRIRRER